MKKTAEKRKRRRIKNKYIRFNTNGYFSQTEKKYFILIKI